jgi:hypothetical protein
MFFNRLINRSTATNYLCDDILLLSDYDPDITTSPIFNSPPPFHLLSRSPLIRWPMRPIFISIRIHPRSHRRSMISTRMCRLRHTHGRGRSVISVLSTIVLIADVAIRSSCGVRVASIHGSWAGREGTDFWICSTSGARRAPVAAEETTSCAAAGGVVVGRGWTVALIALVAAAEPELGDCCNEEDEAMMDWSVTGLGRGWIRDNLRCEKGDGKNGGFEPACGVKSWREGLAVATFMRVWWTIA